MTIGFRKIIQLLISPHAEDCWLVYQGKAATTVKGKDVKPGDRISLGNKENFIRVTGFSQASLKNLLENWDRPNSKGKLYPPNPRYDLFMNMAELLSVLNKNGCPLTDPETGDVIVFKDFELDGVAYPGWTHLQALYALELPPAEYYLYPVLESQRNAPPKSAGEIDLNEIMADLSRDLPVELRLKLDGFPDLHISQSAIATLGVLVVKEMQLLGVKTIEDFADRAAAIAAAPNDDGQLTQHLINLLKEKRLPNDIGETRFILSVLALVLHDFEGKPFEDNVMQLAQVCGFVQE